ncbi:MAG TPA: hypothetical protein VGV38_16090 [Pyrinomonadaceae bacterium]|nr:hypothetical protein [Pyrinomonadaceae bacterium]
MTALVFLVGAALAGAGLVRRVFGSFLSHAEQALWGLVVGWMVSTAAAYLLARAFGELRPGPSVALGAALWCAAVVLWLPAWKRLRRERPSLRSFWREEYAAMLAVCALFAPVYCWLYLSRMLEPGAEGVYSGGSTWYDLGLHLAITTSFLHGRNFPPVYTPLPPEPLLYPFLPDFQTALLASLGLSLRASLLLTSIPLALALTGLFYSFARRLLEDWDARTTDGRTHDADAQVSPHTPPRDADAPTNGASSKTTGADSPRRSTHLSAALATLLFLLNGGLGFLYLFTDWRQSGKGLWEFLSRLEVNYANMGGREIQWTNLVTDTLLPQRASLYGISAALVVFTVFVAVWRDWTGREHDARWRGWRLLLPAGLLTGLLPSFHTHTYAAVGLLSGFLFLLRPRRAWLAFWLPAVLLAAPHFAHLFAHVAAERFVRFQPGWRGHNVSNWPLYWLMNVGAPLLLIIPAWLSAPRAWRVFYLAFVALLVFSLLVVVSPNDYDNVKLMYYWHAATSVFVAAWLVRLATIHRQRLVASLLALACVASGLLALLHESTDRKLLYTREELQTADFARRHTAPRSLFLAAPTVHQPVLSLAGRAVLRGDTAWLWSHGYDFRQREADVKAVYAGRDDASELLRHYRVDYVYFGPRERQLPGANEAYFEQNFPLVHVTERIRVYDTRPPEAKNNTTAGVYARKLFEPYPPREFAARLDKDPAQVLSEFPRAAFAVYRYHKVAFGRRPRHREFMDDLRAVGRGLYVGAPGWQRVLENNKRILADSLAARPEFATLHAGRTDEQFVSALYQNAALTPTRAEHDALVADLSRGSETRSGALARVAENRELYARDYDDAYVLAHYFGYLRRDPDAPPDRDLTGFNFWLTDLRRTGDRRSLGRVFLESGEYKDSRR